MLGSAEPARLRRTHAHGLQARTGARTGPSHLAKQGRHGKQQKAGRKHSRYSFLLMNVSIVAFY
jgi:hypothetical protein